jgi:hypothetical protein
MRGVAIIVLLVAACSTERAPRDAPCRYDSDCADALVCAAGTCRAECAEDRDCDPGWSCGPSGVPRVRACLPPASPVLCAYDSECPAQAFCVDRQCRPECLEDRDCEDGARCQAGVCDRPLVTPNVPDGGVALPDGGPCQVCGERCVDLMRDPEHCGDCGHACAALDACVDGECVPTADCTGGVGAPMICGDACVDVATDPRHCGGCDAPCPEGVACRAGACVPENDECEGARVLDVSGGSAYDHIPSGGLGDSPSSCDGRPDAFWRFELTERAIVYTWAIHGGENVAVGISSACGLAPTGCDDVICTSGRGQIVRVLEPGSYVLTADSAPFGVLGELRVLVAQVPVGDADVEMLPVGSSTVSGATTARLDSPGSCTPGPDRAYWWVSCAGTGAGAFRASVCGSTTFDAVLGLAHGEGLPRVCASPPTACSLTAAIAEDTGLHVLFVDGATASDAGDYTLTVEVPP